VFGNRNSEIVYLFRSVPFIRDFVEAQIDDCDEELRGSILDLLTKIKTAADEYTNLPRSQKGETKELRKAMRDVLITLRLG
jgi:hypothetical protein